MKINLCINILYYHVLYFGFLFNLIFFFFRKFRSSLKNYDFPIGLV